MRVQSLLDVVEAMMLESDIEDIGYYDIVKRAGMSPASVYHFFPSKPAIFEALAGRYFDDFIKKNESRDSGRAWDTWQDYIADGIKDSVAYYNAHPGAMRLILGAQPFLEIRRADDAANIAISSANYRTMSEMYELPKLKDGERKFLLAVTIGDAVCRLSYTTHAHITAEFAEETQRAVIAYYRTFLPDYLERRR